MQASDVSSNRLKKRMPESYPKNGFSGRKVELLPLEVATFIDRNSTNHDLKPLFQSIENAFLDSQKSQNDLSNSYFPQVENRQFTPPPSSGKGPRLAGKGTAGVGPLGINAKYDAIRINKGQNPVFGLESRMNARAQRFALQSVARSILPKSRTAKCLRIRAHNSEVQVWKHCEHKTAAFAGLQTCGSVWVCACCGAKVAERRRVELQTSMAMHKAQGGTVNLLTLTTPHQKTDKLSELLQNQAKALKRFWADRSVLKVFAEMGVIGHVRALEVTHGRKSPSNNGWHPHYHCLMFCGSGVDLGAFSAEQMMDWRVRLYTRWSACCVKSELGAPSFAHGLRLDDGEKAGNYVAKWGLEDEMTKGHTKKARHGETPFDFLRSYLADPSDRQAAALFHEFAEAFKGKRQLHWSHGLKARFAIEETTDEQLCEKVEESAVLLGMVTVDQWRDVLKVDGRATVLEIAARSGWYEVERYLWFIDGVSRGVSLDSEMLLEARKLLLPPDDPAPVSCQTKTLKTVAKKRVAKSQDLHV